MFTVIIICEILSTFLIIYGFIHEDKLVAFEDKIIRWCRRKFKKAKRIYKAIKVSICAKALEKEGITINKKGA